MTDDNRHAPESERLSAVERELRENEQTERALPGKDYATLLDAQVLLDTCGDDPSILEEICRVMAAHMPRHLSALEVALAAGDARRLSEAAHKLCGMVSTFSSSLGQLVAKLEDRAERGDWFASRRLVEQLPSLTRQLLDEVAGVSLESLRAQLSVTAPQAT